MTRVLVIKLGALGDFVQALAAMRRTREAHPEAEITLLTTPPFAALGEACPYVDRVETDGRPGWLGLLPMIARLRRQRYDRVYDLQTNSRSSAYFQLLRPNPPEWSGIAAGCALPHRNPRRDDMHTLERQAEQLKDAGIWPDAPTAAGTAPPPDLSWLAREGVAATLGLTGRYVLLVPGGSPHRLDKRWPVERYTELARLLSEQGLAVGVVGGPTESALARPIGAGVDLTGRTDFAQLAALGAGAELAVGNDTGPTHLIAATGAPTLALFGAASDPALCAPRGARTAYLRAKDLAGLPLDAVLGRAAGLLTAG